MRNGRVKVSGQLPHEKSGWRPAKEMPTEWWPCACFIVGIDCATMICTASAPKLNPPHYLNCSTCRERRVRVLGV